MMSRRTRWRRFGPGVAMGAALGLMLGLNTGMLRAQQDAPARSQYADMEHVGGEVAAVAGATLTVKTEDGKMRQIVTTTNTRIMRGRGNAVKLADLKVGDGVVAVGNVDGPGGTMHAAMVFATDAVSVRAMRENLGKTYIAGKVTAINADNATITIERPDHVVQTIGLDETTSFRKGRRGEPGIGAGAVGPGAGGGQDAGAAENITLADVQVGDIVRGTGALKSGVFVPVQLIVLPPDAGRMERHRATPAGPA
jgi:hypothetical protein